MLPDEGTVNQINTINLLRRAPTGRRAIAFMAYALSAAAQKSVAERMYYAPTNATVQIDPEAEARTAASPFNMAKVVPVDWKEMARVARTLGPSLARLDRSGKAALGFTGAGRASASSGAHQRTAAFADRPECLVGRGRGDQFESVPGIAVLSEGFFASNR